MQYLGSKKRLAKYLLPIILKDRESDQYYVEPFCGGCNMIDKVKNHRIANDVHFYLIKMWKALQNGWLPPESVNEEHYKHIKDNKEKYDPKLVGFVGFNSFAGKWFAGYRRNKVKSNFCKQARESVLKQVPFLKEIEFHNEQYFNLKIPSNSIIYCDPPYQSTVTYKDTSNFDHELFWDWSRDKSDEGHKIFISEYNAPEDFECVWEKEVLSGSSINGKPRNKRIEKLFVYRG